MRFFFFFFFFMPINLMVGLGDKTRWNRLYSFRWPVVPTGGCMGLRSSVKGDEYSSLMCKSMGTKVMIPNQFVVQWFPTKIYIQYPFAVGQKEPISIVTIALFSFCQQGIPVVFEPGLITRTLFLSTLHEPCEPI